MKNALNYFKKYTKMAVQTLSYSPKQAKIISMRFQTLQKHETLHINKVCIKKSFWWWYIILTLFMMTSKVYFKQFILLNLFHRNWVFATISNFRIPISLQRSNSERKIGLLSGHSCLWKVRLTPINSEKAV